MGNANVKTVDYGERNVKSEQKWAWIHKTCEIWYAMNKREREILERQEAQEQHEAAQKKRISNGRLAEMRRRDLTEYGEEEDDGISTQRINGKLG